MIKIYLDMDGTIADLYGQENWLLKLQNEDTQVFRNCEPLISEFELISQLENIFKEEIKIVILSMTPKYATKEYCEQVKQQKEEWLNKFFPNITQRIYKPYGHNKNLKNSKNTILIDDNEIIRENFKGLALAPWWC